MSDEQTPLFAQDFAIDTVDAASITVIHRPEGHWWRFEVAEKNGRRQLVHADHEAGPNGGDPRAQAVDAYDTATWEARRHGMVD